MLEYFLIDVILIIECVKDQFLGKVYKFRKEYIEFGFFESFGEELVVGFENGECVLVFESMDDRDYVFLYVYILVVIQIVEDLKKVRVEIEGLFGVLNEEVMFLE